jgi:hypothetical protein
MADEISMDESRKIMAVATNVRPDENIHHDPALQPPPVPRSRPVTAEESKRILSLAANVRPLENVHPGDQDDENDD